MIKKPKWKHYPQDKPEPETYCLGWQDEETPALFYYDGGGDWWLVPSGKDIWPYQGYWTEFPSPPSVEELTVEDLAGLK